MTADVTPVLNNGRSLNSSISQASIQITSGHSEFSSSDVEEDIEALRKVSSIKSVNNQTQINRNIEIFNGFSNITVQMGLNGELEATPDSYIFTTENRHTSNGMRQSSMILNDETRFTNNHGVPKTIYIYEEDKLRIFEYSVETVDMTDEPVYYDLSPDHKDVKVVKYLPSGTSVISTGGIDVSTAYFQLYNIFGKDCYQCDR